MRIDASGRQCPIPVVMAKKELEAGVQDVEIIVDGQTQIDNLVRLGDTLGRPATSEAFGENFLVKFANGECKASEAGADDGSYAVFFNTDAIGTNEGELGRNLAKMAIFTLSESDNIPSYVLFMNEGVKLVCGETQIADNLNTLIEKGTKVLVCGTCLNFYGIKDEIKVGTVSNMYDILGAMQEVSKVIKLQDYSKDKEVCAVLSCMSETMNEYYLYTFESTHAAISTEKLLKSVGCMIMPVPRFISASCGISIRVKPELSDAADEVFMQQSKLSEGEYAYYHITGDKSSDHNGNVKCDRLR